jgi:hypothetical protein
LGKGLRMGEEEHRELLIHIEKKMSEVEMLRKRKRD